MTEFSEAAWEHKVLDELAEHEWIAMSGSDIAPGTDNGRESWSDIVLPDRILAKMRELNPHVPVGYLDQARAQIITPRSQDAITENFRLHRYLVEGYRGISYIDSDGIEQNPTIRLISHRPEENEFLAVQQVTIRTTDKHRRFDVVLYLNGMPVAIFELKQAGAQPLTSPPRTRNSKPIDANSQWLSGSRCSPSSAMASTPATAHHSPPWSISRRGTSTTTASLSRSGGLLTSWTCRSSWRP